MNIRKIFTLVFFILVSFLTACAPRDVANTSLEMANQGILPLSTNNPYVGSNIFMVQEMERSSFLHNFIKSNSAPTAIEIIETTFASPKILLFYPAKQEVFSADLLKYEGQPQWIVRGPFPMEKDDFNKLKRMDLAMNGEPIFLMEGQEVRFRGNNQLVVRPPRMAQVEPTPQPLPTKPIKKPTVRPKAAMPKRPTATPTPNLSGVNGSFKPQNSDQQAISISQGFAERADNGDVIHTVKKDNQTIESITQWYTGNIDNSVEVSQMNHKGSDTKAVLPLGTKIRIPFAKLITAKAMP